MGLDIISILMIWIAIQVQGKKSEDTGSTLDNFGWFMLQIILVGTAMIITKSNPYV